MTELESLRLQTGYRSNSWKAFVFVLQFIKPFWPKLLLVCLLDISIVLTNLVIPWLGKAIIDQGFANRDWDLVLRLSLGVAGLSGLVFGMFALRTFMYNATEMLVGLHMRKVIYRHLQSLSLTFVEATPVGQQQFRVITDADRIAHMLVRILPTLTMLVEFALILTASIYVEPVLTVIVLLFLIPWTILFIYVTHFGRMLDRRRLEFAEQRDSGVLQAARSFSTLKSLGRVDHEIRRNTLANIAVQRISMQGYLILVGFEFVTQKLLPYLKSTTIFLFLANKVVLGQMTLGMTVPMIAYLSRLAFPIERIVNFGCWIWQTMVSAERIMFLMQTEPAIRDGEGDEIPHDFEPSIVFDHVTVERDGVGKVVDNISLSIAPNSWVALVGPSGAGKSTLVDVLLRLLDPQTGQVYIGGQPIHTLRRESIMRHVGTVTQETFIFGGTLADNLRIAFPLATENDLTTVLHQVQLMEWVDSHREGLARDLEGGIGLSAGQKQRIGIARALLSNPKILVLDEPTSALDPETERGIMDTIHDIAASRTVVMVTHRLETVKAADRVIVLNRGAIVEDGTYESLSHQRGLFAEMLWLHSATTSEAKTTKEMHLQ